MSKELNVRIYNIVWEEPSVDECDWYCDECDANLNEQIGFDSNCGTWRCQECGHVNHIDSDNIIDIDLPNEDYDTFYVYGSSDEVEDEIPDYLEEKYGRRPISFDYDYDDDDDEY